ncbi:MAG: chemotaxis protein CheW [Desulfuromonadaceae bacterium]|nr:chemotaxis protein CheW [Desulfuromonadaceae bacterium]
MDLAKIRKKSLQTVEESDNASLCASACPPAECINDTQQVVASAPLSAGSESFHDDSSTRAVSLIAAAPFYENNMLQSFAEPRRSPLEAILAGRSAAGCDDESIIEHDDISEAHDKSGLEYLCFRVSDEIYGINIMDIKEIIKQREVTEVPRAPAFVLGILSLRGTIIPIIDMRIRLDLARSEQTGKERVIVVKNKNSFSGLLVDEVIQVVRVKTDVFEAPPTVLDGINRDFISGIRRSDERMIIIVNVENIADIDLY